MNLPVKTQTSLMVALTQQDQSMTILAIIQRAVLIAGTKPAENEIIVMVTEVQELINTRYNTLTIAEIADTVRNGVLGDYTDSFLCVRNINTWLRGIQAAKLTKQELINKKADKAEQIHMAEKSNFLLSNIDKMPNLKALLGIHKSTRIKR